MGIHQTQDTKGGALSDLHNATLGMEIHQLQDTEGDDPMPIDFP
jgi:hypothetical protein